MVRQVLSKTSEHSLKIMFDPFSLTFKAQHRHTSTSTSISISSIICISSTSCTSSYSSIRSIRSISTSMFIVVRLYLTRSLSPSNISIVSISNISISSIICISSTSCTSSYSSIRSIRSISTSMFIVVRLHLTRSLSPSTIIISISIRIQHQEIHFMLSEIPIE